MQINTETQWIKFRLLVFTSGNLNFLYLRRNYLIFCLLCQDLTFSPSTYIAQFCCFLNNNHSTMRIAYYSVISRVESVCLLLNYKLKEVVLSPDAKCPSYMQLCSGASTADWLLHSFFVAVDPGSPYVLQRTYWVLRHNDYPFCVVFFFLFFEFKFIEIMTGLLCSPSSWCFSVCRLRTHIECCGLRLEAMWVHCRETMHIKGLCKAGGANSRISIKTLKSSVLSDLSLKLHWEITSKKASCSYPHQSKVTLKQCRHLYVWHSAGFFPFINISLTDPGVKVTKS